MIILHSYSFDQDDYKFTVGTTPHQINLRNDRRWHVPQNQWQSGDAVTSQAPANLSSIFCGCICPATIPMRNFHHCMSRSNNHLFYLRLFTTSDHELSSDHDEGVVTYLLNSNRNENEPRRRKRARYMSQWKASEAKLKQNASQSYVSHTTKPVRACVNESMKEIFHALWGMGPYDSQNTCIQKLVKSSVNERRKSTGGGQSLSNTTLFMIT